MSPNSPGLNQTDLLIRATTASISSGTRSSEFISKSSGEHASRMLNAAIRNDVFYPAYMSLKSSANIVSKRDFYNNLYHQYLTANAVWLATSYRILNLFKDEGLGVMPIKGFHLSHFYYPNPLMRYAWDTDFLFKSKRDKEKAEGILLQENFHVDYLSPLETKFTKRFSRFSVHIETHTSPGSIMYSFEFPRWGDLWSQSTQVPIAGATVHLMRPEYVLLVICASMCSRGTFTARDFLDLRQVITRSKSFRWDVISEAGEKSIWRYILLIPLHLVNHVGEKCLGETLVPNYAFDRLSRNGNPTLPADFPDILPSIIQGAGLPVDYRDILLSTGYALTPLFANFFLWTKMDPTLRNRILRVILEPFNIPTFVRKDFGERYAASCLRSWFSAYLARFARKHNRVSKRGRSQESYR